MSNALEFEKHFFAVAARRPLKMLAIPCDAGREVLDVPAKCVVFIPGMRGRDILPSGVVEITVFGSRHIADKQAPIGIKVVFDARTRLRKADYEKYHEDQRKDGN